jgi:hypothetical protein
MLAARTHGRLSRYVPSLDHKGPATHTLARLAKAIKSRHLGSPLLALSSGSSLLGAGQLILIIVVILMLVVTSSHCSCPHRGGSIRGGLT